MIRWRSVKAAWNAILFRLFLTDFSNPKVCTPLAESSGLMNIESHRISRTDGKNRILIFFRLISLLHPVPPSENASECYPVTTNQSNLQVTGRTWLRDPGSGQRLEYFFFRCCMTTWTRSKAVMIFPLTMHGTIPVIFFENMICPTRFNCWITDTGYSQDTSFSAGSDESSVCSTCWRCAIMRRWTGQHWIRRSHVEVKADEQEYSHEGTEWNNS
jgi:hypothetical protein